MYNMSNNMDIWITRCRKTARCKYCEKPILVSEPIVKGRLWRRKKWTLNFYWHPDCWVEQGIAEMEKRPVIETRGRKSLPLTAEIQEKRICLLKRRASVIQRLKRETDPVKVLHLGEMLEDLKEEIKPLGGVPKTW